MSKRQTKPACASALAPGRRIAVLAFGASLRQRRDRRRLQLHRPARRTRTSPSAPGTSPAPAGTAAQPLGRARPPAARPCARTPSASPTRGCPAGPRSSSLPRPRRSSPAVIDRGPYVRGRAWDFTSAASEALDFEGVGRVRYAVATRLARTHHHRRVEAASRPAPGPPPHAAPAAPKAKLPCLGSADHERSSIHVEVFAPEQSPRSAAAGRVGWHSPRWRARSCSRSSSSPARAPKPRSEGRPSSSARPRRRPTPPARRPALPGGRQRHRLPGQQRPDQSSVPGPHNGTIKAWTLTLAQPTN